MDTFLGGVEEKTFVVFASADAFILTPLLLGFDVAEKRLTGSNALAFL
jgi:hypothetical protein